MASRLKEKISIRERMAIRLFIWMISILAPWEYEHQQKEFIEGLKRDLKDAEQ